MIIITITSTTILTEEEQSSNIVISSMAWLLPHPGRGFMFVLAGRHVRDHCRPRPRVSSCTSKLADAVQGDETVSSTQRKMVQNAFQGSVQRGGGGAAGGEFRKRAGAGHVLTGGNPAHRGRRTSRPVQDRVTSFYKTVKRETLRGMIDGDEMEGQRP